MWVGIGLGESLLATSSPIKGNRLGSKERKEKKPLYFQRCGILAAFIHKYKWTFQDCQIREEVNRTKEKQ